MTVYVMLPNHRLMLCFLFVTYSYNKPHRQAYVSFRFCKILISRFETVNSHIYKTIYTAINNAANCLYDKMFQIQCDNKRGEILI